MLIWNTFLLIGRVKMSTLFGCIINKTEDLEVVIILRIKRKLKSFMMKNMRAFLEKLPKRKLRS